MVGMSACLWTKTQLLVNICRLLHVIYNATPKQSRERSGLLFTGHIPAELSLLTNLTILAMSMCRVNGGTPKLSFRRQ